MIVDGCKGTVDSLWLEYIPFGSCLKNFLLTVVYTDLEEHLFCEMKKEHHLKDIKPMSLSGKLKKAATERSMKFKMLRL